jgi:hypothetical protein
MKSTVFALLSIALLATSAQAYETALCLTKAPTNWVEVDGGILSTQVRGPAAIVNVDAGRVTWVATGGTAYLNAKREGGKLTILKVSGGNPGAEQIAKADTDKTKFTTVHSLKLEDSMGGFGYMTVVIPNDEQKYMDGYAMWLDANSGRESFEFCTTQILK